jgi:hypothetical protein
MADHSPSEATALQVSADAFLIVSTNIVHALVVSKRVIPMFLVIIKFGKGSKIGLSDLKNLSIQF